jgi:hypothetical protein
MLKRDRVQGAAGTSLPMNTMGPVGVPAEVPPSGSTLIESVAFTRSTGESGLIQAEIVGSDWETIPSELGAADPPSVNQS